MPFDQRSVDTSYEIHMNTQYELLYIIPATFTDEDLSGIEANVKAMFDKYGGTIESTTRLGKFRFAYPIKAVRHGHYILVRWSGDGSIVNKIDEALRISPEVLRHLILRADEAGGDKFDLVQFTEVNLDAKESSDDRGRRGAKPDERKAEIKSGVAALEGEKDETVVVAAEKELSPEELEKKIDTALQDNA